jgi:hypothetical protein
MNGVGLRISVVLLAQVTRFRIIPKDFREENLIRGAWRGVNSPKPDVVKTYLLASSRGPEILMAVEFVTVKDHRCSYDGANAGRTANSTPTGLWSSPIALVVGPASEW